MRKQYTAQITIPNGVHCDVQKDVVTCTKGAVTLEKKIVAPETTLTIETNTIQLTCKRANRKHIASINSALAHIKNVFQGLEKDFEYKLEICHVHFPMTAKVEGQKLIISNFLGEKKQRTVSILTGVRVDVKGNEISVLSRDIEKAGQTAANIEKATKVPKKDRRVFQDGIFITMKPGGKV